MLVLVRMGQSMILSTCGRRHRGVGNGLGCVVSAVIFTIFLISIASKLNEFGRVRVRVGLRL